MSPLHLIVFLLELHFLHFTTFLSEIDQDDCIFETSLNSHPSSMSPLSEDTAGAADWSSGAELAEPNNTDNRATPYPVALSPLYAGAAMST